LIDWFTVGAQALNFVILVWLLKRFLYKPILAAIDAREKHIAGELANADTKRGEAERQKADFEHKNEEFEQQRGALLAKATGDATAEGQRLLEVARQAADTLSAKRQEALGTDARNLNLALRRRAQHEVFAIARRTLKDLAGADLEKHMVDAFAARIRALDSKMKAELGRAATSTAEPAQVRSALALSQEQQDRIRNTLNETLSADIPLRFETTPDLVAGIELTLNGRKLAWSISAYLDSLEQAVNELVKAKPA
ncbi:MAG: F0F1 ATP synthase subunit delta, partial [Pseudomonadota bacterium]